LPIGFGQTLFLSHAPQQGLQRNGRLIRRLAGLGHGFCFLRGAFASPCQLFLSFLQPFSAGC